MNFTKRTIKRYTVLAWVITATVGLVLLAMVIRLTVKYDNLAFLLGLIPALGLVRWVYRKTKPTFSGKVTVDAATIAERQQILARDVLYYQLLNPEEQTRFLNKVNYFIAHKPIEGVGTTVDEKVRTLVAASAVIPVFNFEEWFYDQVSTVLIYPQSFGLSFLPKDDPNRNIIASGLAGTERLANMVVLSKPDLINGFLYGQRNVGIHEFAHVVDRADGSIDGIPGLYMPDSEQQRWTKLIDYYSPRFAYATSPIDPYASTNPAEFFAVLSEYFFDQPLMLLHQFPDLYACLKSAYLQDPAPRQRHYLHGRLAGMTLEELGALETCPCGSGMEVQRCLKTFSRAKAEPLMIDNQQD